MGSFFELCDTFAANILALEVNDVVFIAAENAVLLEFSEDNGIFLNIDLKCVLFADIKTSAEFDRKNDSSEFVDLTGNSCCFHSNNLSFLRFGKLFSKHNFGLKIVFSNRFLFFDCFNGQPINAKCRFKTVSKTVTENAELSDQLFP